MLASRTDAEVRAEFEGAWGRFLVAEWDGLEARKAGRLARALGAALPEEPQEELDRTAEEDRRLAHEGLVLLMDEQAETRHKRLDELVPADAADRVRAEDALLDRLMRRTEERLWNADAWLARTRDRGPSSGPGAPALREAAFPEISRAGRLG